VISIIIPVGPSSPFLSNCLEGLKNSTSKNFEVILVFDGWQGDGFIDKNYSYSIKSLTVEKAGPAKCRNEGAKLAENELLLFLDSDVVLHKESIAMALHSMQAKNADAIIGSYDDAPAQKDFVSQFRNLLHHYHHQQNNGQEAVFWGAFGLIKKKVFTAVGGFNENFTEPSVEDIELGYRLHDQGYLAILDASILLKHLKKWTITNMVYTDVFKRALPWTILLAKHNKWSKNKLNTNSKEKLTALVALLNFCFLFLGIWQAYFLYVAFFSLLIFILLQKSFYAMLARKCTIICCLTSIILHHIYYFSAIAGFFFAQFKLRSN